MPHLQSIATITLSLFYWLFTSCADVEIRGVGVGVLRAAALPQLKHFAIIFMFLFLSPPQQ
jgi:hypothetical protein